MSGKRAASLMAKQVAAGALACLMAFSALALASCSGGGSERVHLLVKVPRTGHDVVFDDEIVYADQVIRLMADEFCKTPEGGNVDIEVEVFEQNQYDSAVEDSFDTPKSPDVLYGDYFNISTYIHTGRVVSLCDVVSDEVRNDVFDYLWDMSTVEGKVYMMPYLLRQNVLAYNKDLFRQAGLEEYIQDGKIASWSLEDWTSILDTLAERLPSGAFPMMMYAASSQGDTHTMTLLRSAGSSFFDESGHFSLSTSEGVAALDWIQGGVSRGWFPPHAENLEIEDCSSLFREGQLAVYMVNNASVSRYGDTVGLVNFPGPDEQGCATVFVSGFEVFDNGDARKVQAAKDFLSFVYGNEELLSYAAGTLPASKSVSDAYSDQIPYFDLFQENSDNVVDFTGSNPDTRAVRDIFYQCIHELLMGNTTPEQAAERIDRECNEAIDAGVAASVLHE